jgi:hypothetical protein
MLEACKVGNFSVAFFTKGKYINEKCGWTGKIPACLIRFYCDHMQGQN